MKTWIRRFIAAAAATLFACAAHAANVNDIIAQMPKKSAEDGRKLTEALVAGGESSISELCKMLKAPGKGKDDKVRYALHGVSLYVSAPGREDARAMTEGALLKALDAASDPHVKGFLIRQIQLVSRGASVTKLGSLLTDAALGEPATQALLAIHTADVAPTLAAALPNVEGKALVMIIRALGELKYKPAADRALATNRWRNL